MSISRPVFLTENGMYVKSSFLIGRIGRVDQVSSNRHIGTVRTEICKSMSNTRVTLIKHSSGLPTEQRHTDDRDNNRAVRNLSTAKHDSFSRAKHE